MHKLFEGFKEAQEHHYSEVNRAYLNYLDDAYHPTIMLTHERQVNDIDNDKRF